MTSLLYFQTDDIDINECRKQWKDLHLLLYDENSSIPPPLTEREREAMLTARKDRIDSMLEVIDHEAQELQRTKKETSNKDTKAWKLGYL